MRRGNRCVHGAPHRTLQSARLAFAPLGISPRDRLIGADILGTQFPDGISIPILACYYPNGRTVTCPIWQLQAYVFPSGITPVDTRLTIQR